MLDQMSGEQLDSDTRALRELMEIKDDDENGLHVHFYDFQSILDATENFSAANKLGQGRYGPVYKVIKEYVLAIKCFQTRVTGIQECGRS